MRGRPHHPDRDFWPRLERQNCWVWTGAIKSNGYGHLSIGKGQLMMAHRYAWMLTNGAIPSGLHVLHLCDNPPCCNPSHLYLGDDADNARDMRVRHRMAVGERVRHSKLTTEQVQAIRYTYAAQRISMKALAQQYRVCPQTICDIVHRLHWRHVE